MSLYFSLKRCRFSSAVRIRERRARRVTEATAWMPPSVASSPPLMTSGSPSEASEVSASRCFFLGGLETSEIRGPFLARGRDGVAVEAGDDEGGGGPGDKVLMPEETVSARRCFPDSLWDMTMKLSRSIR